MFLKYRMVIVSERLDAEIFLFNLIYYRLSIKIYDEETIMFN